MKKSDGFAGALWFAGWLFTIGYANLLWWKVILGIVVWQFYLSMKAYCYGDGSSGDCFAYVFSKDGDLNVG